MKRIMAPKKEQVFLTSVDQNQKEIFKNKFVKINLTKLTSQKKDRQNLRLLSAWQFPLSEKNMKIWNKISINDWLFFYFNGKYSFAGKITKKEKSQRLAKELFGESNKNKSLLVFCKDIFPINKGFQKTNADMGFDKTIPEMHRINLIQAKENALTQILKKYGSVESYLKIKKPTLKKKPITELIPSSIKKDLKKIQTTTLRRVRDTKKAEQLKRTYSNQCQICNYSFPEYVEKGYSEVHHVWPMAEKGDDDFDNMLVLCPNHHTEFDYGVIQFSERDSSKIQHLDGKDIGTIFFKKGHKLDEKNIKFHNMKVKRIFFES
jgi:predicted HNH restriction endonuclease